MQPVRLQRRLLPSSRPRARVEPHFLPQGTWDPILPLHRLPPPLILNVDSMSLICFVRIDSSLADLRFDVCSSITNIVPDQTREKTAEAFEMSNNQNRRMSSIPGVPNSFPLANMRLAAQHLLGDVPGLQAPLPPPPPQQQPRIRGALPLYIRPLPSRYDIVDVDYLEAKGALRIPDLELRTELIKAYVRFVHPFMPLLELDDFLSTIAQKSPKKPVSLLLFQAVMFAGTAYVPIEFLHAAGFSSRKIARKTFFLRARILYDLDYESDRIALVQSLLLMTHWYEMPDDQKDTWHWMGVSLSLAHTIGIHRDPSSSSLDLKQQRLWKRIWWSTYTRDREIALGMRRPTRIKDEDCDVPLPTVDDFNIQPLSPQALQAAGNCELLLDLGHQRDLAQLFIEKSKLCLCISHVLTTQYSVLSHKNFGGSKETTMMLVPKKAAAEGCEVRKCDQELEMWFARLPAVARYYPSGPVSLSKLSSVEEVLHTHRALLKMVYLTTSSALHRPQVLPSTPVPQVEVELQELSRAKVRKAAVEITDVAQDLYRRELVRYLPTTGITVLLPAVIIHLLDIKCNNATVRQASLSRFYQCMQILQQLREIYFSADFASQFLEAAIRKADINLSSSPQDQQNQHGNLSNGCTVEGNISASVGDHRANLAANGVGTEGNLRHASSTQNNMPIPPQGTCPPNGGSLTPPPDLAAEDPPSQPPLKFSFQPGPTFSTPVISGLDHLEQNRNDGVFTTATPPQSVPSENGSTNNINPLVNIENRDQFSSESPFAINLQMLNNRGNVGSMGFGIPGLTNPATSATPRAAPTVISNVGASPEKSYIANPDTFTPSTDFDMETQDLNTFRTLAHDVDITPNDLDALINFDDAVGDFFVGTDMEMHPEFDFNADVMGKMDMNGTSDYTAQSMDWMTLGESSAEAPNTMATLTNMPVHMAPNNE